MITLWKFVLSIALLASCVMAAFIQSPVPPSSRENFLYDPDKDGRLDLISIKFLGAVSREYLNAMVDSLTFDWIDSSGEVSHERCHVSDFELDRNAVRRVNVNLKSRQKNWLVQTDSRSLGNVRLFLKGGSVYSVHVQDRMAPVVQSAQLRSHLDESLNDTLNVLLSEPVSLKNECSDFLEFKSGSNVFSLQAMDVQWNKENSSATVILNAKSLMPRDSVRLRPECVFDLSGNRASDSAVFVYANGFYPLNFEIGSMAVSNEILNGANVPIFQLRFETAEEKFPNDEEWGVGMDLLTPEFNGAVKDALGMKSTAVLEPSKLRIQYNVKIYTNLGEYIVGTTSDVYGDDERFEGTAKRLFLKWNLMDAKHRRMGTGAYIANAAVVVTYDGTLVYRSDVRHGPAAKIFGVKRR